MTVPSMFDTSFVYREITARTDVQDLLDLIVQAITGTLPTGTNLPVADRWTSLGLGEYQSPAQDPTGANRSMRVVVTRVSATRLQFFTKEKTGATVLDGTIDFTTSYDGRVWAGPRHLFAEMEYGASVYEVAYAVMTDPAPFGLSSTPLYVMGYARRNSAGTQIGSNFADEAAMNDGLGAGNLSRRIGMFNEFAGQNLTGETSGGSHVVLPAEVAARQAGIDVSVGKMMQCIVAPRDMNSEVVVEPALDVGVIGQFKVLGLPGPTVNQRGRLAVRVG